MQSTKFILCEVVQTYRQTLSAHASTSVSIHFTELQCKYLIKTHTET